MITCQEIVMRRYWSS